MVFGPEDEFFNRFAELSRFLPVLPAFAEGTAKLQPVYVSDIALAAAKALDDGLKPGATYELGGPETMTLIEAMNLAMRIAERRRYIAPLPHALSRWMAHGTEIASALSLGLFPEMLTTTRDQVDLLRADNVVTRGGERRGPHLRRPRHRTARPRGDTAALSHALSQDRAIRLQSLRVSGRPSGRANNCDMGALRET